MRDEELEIDKDVIVTRKELKCVCTVNVVTPYHHSNLSTVGH